MFLYKFLRTFKKLNNDLVQNRYFVSAIFLVRIDVIR